MIANPMRNGNTKSHPDLALRRSREAILRCTEKAGLDTLNFHQLDAVPDLTPGERDELYRALMDHFQIGQKRAAIRQWLAEQDEKRAAREMSSDLSALLNAL